MKSRITLLALFLVAPILSSQSEAQRFSYEFWHEGTLTLLDNREYTGKIKYDFQNEVIQFQSDRGGNQAYTCKSFLKFTINDALQEIVRVFYSLPYHPEAGYEAPRLFEVLIEGKMNLLSREEKEVTRRNPSYGMYMLPTQEDIVYTYYILKEGERLKLFNGKKSVLMSLMGRQSSEVQKYMKQNRLSVKKRAELVRIIAYYNALFAK